MKDLLNIYLKDIQVENFSKRECVVYGVIAPMMLVVVCMISSIF